MYTLGRPLRSRCITSSLYVPEAVKMVPETVTCDIIAICWIWDMLTFQSHAVSEPNRLPEAFWMLFRYVSHIRRIDVSKSFHTRTASQQWEISLLFHGIPIRLQAWSYQINPNHVIHLDLVWVELHAAFNLGDKALAFLGAAVSTPFLRCQDTGAAAGLCCNHPASWRHIFCDSFGQKALFWISGLTDGLTDSGRIC